MFWKPGTIQITALQAVAILLVAAMHEPLTGAAAPGYHPNQVLVMPRDGAAARPLRNLHRSLRSRVQREFPLEGGLQVVALPKGLSVEKAVADYRASGLVRFAEPDYAISAASTFPSDPRFQDGTQWGLNNYGQAGGTPDADIDAPEAWDIGSAAADVVVAIIDTGILPTHEDLAANLWSNPLDGSPGFNAFTEAHDPWDDHGHGTHVAGIIGAVGNNGKGVTGVAWRVRLMACKALDSAGNGYYSRAIACIEFARTNGAQVINMSWGGPEYSLALSNALWLARNDGIAIVAAAGNSAQNIDVSPYYPASFAFDNIVSVGASTRQDSAWILSNTGASNVDLFAPGAAVYSTAWSTNSNSNYTSRDGTSMASGWVAGAMALLRERDPGASPQELIGLLLSATDRKPAFFGKCVTGGRLNLRKALDRPALSLASWAMPIELQIAGAPLHSYVLSASTNLIDWTPVRTNFTDGLGEAAVVLPESLDAPMGFYRAAPAP